jgi:hypothetical protein
MARTKRATLVGDDAADGPELCCSGHIGTLVGIGLAAAHVDPFDFALCYRRHAVSSAHFALH